MKTQEMIDSIFKEIVQKRYADRAWRVGDYIGAFRQWRQASKLFAKGDDWYSAEATLLSAIDMGKGQGFYADKKRMLTIDQNLCKKYRELIDKIY